MMRTGFGHYRLAHLDEPGCVCGVCCQMPRQEVVTADDDDTAPVDPVSPARAPFADLLEVFGVLARLLGRFDGPLPLLQTAVGTTEPSADGNPNDADQGVDALLIGARWNTTSLTYSFPDSASDYEGWPIYHPWLGTGERSTFQAFSTTQQAVARDALEQYAAISGLSFQELGDDAGEREIDADIRFGSSDYRSTAWAYPPAAGSDNPRSGDIWFNAQRFEAPKIGSYEYVTFLHETGHAVGLKHGHDGSGTGAIPFERDSMEFSVMTYRSWVGKPLTYGYANETWGFAQSLMMYDIAAIQRMYGADFGLNAGDTVYSLSTTTGELFIDGVGTGQPGGNRVFRTIWDGDGTDTYDFSNYTTDLVVDLAPGGYVDLDADGQFQRAMLDFGYQSNPVVYARGHLFNALQYEGDPRSLIENATGGRGDDVFYGNAADNTLVGNGGNDRFYDSEGIDTYVGGNGTDQLVVEGRFQDYGFGAAGDFLKLDLVAAAGAVFDWVARTVEEIVFADRTEEVSALFALTGGPTAVADGYVTGEDAQLEVSVAANGLLGNDLAADGGALTVASVDQAATVGTVSVAPDGTFTYDPAGRFETLAVGETATDSFGYVVSEAGGGTAQGTATVTIEGRNDAPTANDDGGAGFRTSADAVFDTANVLANDTDPDANDTLSVFSFDTTGTVGTVTDNGDGTFRYDPNGQFDLAPGETATDRFSYTVADPGGETASATVTVTVEGTAPTPESVVVDFEGGSADLPGVSLSGVTPVANGTLGGGWLGVSGSDGRIVLDAGAGSFDFQSVLIRAASGFYTSVSVEGFSDGVEVASESFFTFSIFTSSVVLGSSFDDVDRVVIDAGRALLVDDLALDILA